MMKMRWYTAAFIAILILAAGVRLYKLTDIPSGFFTDEAAVGVNAYTILTNGTDQYGTPFPFFFKAFGEYKGGISVYSAVPFVFALGLTEFAIRLTSVVFALLGIAAVYFLSLELFKNHPHRRIIALLAALFLAISPWHIHYSRVGWDAYMQFIFLTALAIYFFLKAQQQPKFLPLSIALFGITLYSYYAARIFIPLLGIALFCMFWRFFLANRKYALISAGILVLVLLPFVHQHLKEETWKNYWKQQSIFLNHGKDESVPHHIAITYLSHFSTEFLFTKGHIDMPGSGGNRHSVRGMGELYLIQLPFILIGFFALWHYKPRTAFGILLAWLLLYPLAASLTTEPSATSTRSIIGVVPFQILTGFGIAAFFAYLKDITSRFAKRIQLILYYGAVALLIIAVALGFAHYLKLYFVQYPHYSGDFWGWQYGSGEILNYFISVDDKYDELYLTPEFNGPEMLILFYSHNLDSGCKNCRVGNWDDKYQANMTQLFSTTPSRLQQSKYNSSFEIKKTVYYPYMQQPDSREIAFLIGEIKKTPDNDSHT